MDNRFLDGNDGNSILPWLIAMLAGGAIWLGILSLLNWLFNWW